MNEKTDLPPDEMKTEQPQPASKQRVHKRMKVMLAASAVLLLIPITYAGYIYAASPAVIREPKLEHYHFRMQILVNGKAENFGEDKYQQDYAKDQCNGNLPEQPIHFHDKKDQFVHIHWNGMTGGMVFKYYGWNYIGGINKALGYKLDDLKDIQKVNTHGNFLPSVPDNAKFYIYTGDKTGYKERSFDSWIEQDLEKFFDTPSNFPGNESTEQAGILDRLFPKAYAHGTEDHGNAAHPTAAETEEEKLTRINNLVGDVVIFVQEDKPTDQQIKERFNKLEPLSASTCGG